jgi:Cell Wall Hydrolase
MVLPDEGDMRRRQTAPFLTAPLLALCVSWLQGCAGHFPGAENEAKTTSAADRDCLIRAMYFESSRSSRAGLLAVGTVVMNRVASPLYPNTICGVVSERRQFAPGVMTRTLDPAELPLVERMADAVLRGRRNRKVGTAMYFHMAGYPIPYRVHYVTVAGGNAFYEKEGTDLGDRQMRKRTETAVASAEVPLPLPKPDAAPDEVADNANGGPTFFQRIGAAFTGGGTESCDSASAGASALGAPGQAGLQQAAFTCEVEPAQPAQAAEFGASSGSVPAFHMAGPH